MILTQLDFRNLLISKVHISFLNKTVSVPNWTNFVSPTFSELRIRQWKKLLQKLCRIYFLCSQESSNIFAPKMIQEFLQ